MKRALAALGLLPLGVLLAAGTAPGADVTISIDGLRSTKGMVHACLTAQPKAFPDCQKDPDALRASVAAGDAGGTVRFAGVRPGTYAVALLHDENANGKADFALGMMPREGFGFSRDARLRMGPPRFADAAFTIAGEDQTMAINMRYLF